MIAPMAMKQRAGKLNPRKTPGYSAMVTGAITKMDRV